MFTSKLGNLLLTPGQVLLLLPHTAAPTLLIVLEHATLSPTDTLLLDVVAVYTQSILFQLVL